eukprot:s679_g17.t1
MQRLGHDISVINFIQMMWQYVDAYCHRVLVVFTWSTNGNDKKVHVYQSTKDVKFAKKSCIVSKERLGLLHPLDPLHPLHPKTPCHVFVVLCFVSFAFAFSCRFKAFLGRSRRLIFNIHGTSLQKIGKL